jgi:hypothetical protein
MGLIKKKRINTSTTTSPQLYKGYTGGNETTHRSSQIKYLDVTSPQK